MTHLALVQIIIYLKIKVAEADKKISRQVTQLFILIKMRISWARRVKTLGGMDKILKKHITNRLCLAHALVGRTYLHRSRRILSDFLGFKFRFEYKVEKAIFRLNFIVKRLNSMKSRRMARLEMLLAFWDKMFKKLVKMNKEMRDPKAKYILLQMLAIKPEVKKCALLQFLI